MILVKHALPVVFLLKNLSQKALLKEYLKLIKIFVLKCHNLNLDESYALYESYIKNHRHLDGDMFPATEKQFSTFILENTDDTIFFKFFDKEKLIAVSVADVLHDGLSAVYCFYDPADKRRSLGTYAILYQILPSFRARAFIFISRLLD